MEKYVRPISRLAAVELPDHQLDVVGGGSCPTTDVYTAYPCDGSPNVTCWKLDGSYLSC
jgi:hypothetical protein